MRLLTHLLILAALPFAAFAGTESSSVSGKESKAIQPACTPAPLYEIIATTDYGFHENLDRGSANMEVEHNAVQLGRRIPLSALTWPNVQCGAWYLRLGAAYERFDFSIHNESRLPNTLQSAAGIVALEYMYDDEAAFMIETRPGVYFEHKINSGSFDSPVTLTMAYPLFERSVFLVAGVYVSALVSPPVFPIGGIDWRINDKWNLRAVFPEPRLVYHYSDTIDLFVGGEVIGGGYKTDNRTVSNPRLSGAVVTYSESRAGAGVTWNGKPISIELAGGYTIQSQFYYNRAPQTFSAHPAPYIRLTASLDF